MDIHRFVGVDVSKLRLDVFVRPDDKVLSFSNDELGIGELVRAAERTGAGACLA